MSETRLTILFERFLSKTCSAAEKQELAVLLLSNDQQEAINGLLEKAWAATGAESDLDPQKADQLFQSIVQPEPVVIPRIQRIHFRKSRWWAAAAILIMVGVGSYFAFLAPRSPKGGVPLAEMTQDVNPGTYKAKLKLADGTEIILDSAALGELAKQGNTSVVNKDGQLVYTGNGGDVLYNTVSTAKGETYTMKLADGSMIWLNSASSIYFPVTFPGKERRIEVTGEVYVKVAKNAEKPFIASANGMEVLALGTEFNINAYLDEEHINTTLVEGSVKVSNGSSVTLLQPGQQTQLSSDGKFTAARSVNMDEVTGWKEGWFHFESADLKTILRQFSRWYDVDVVYEGPVTDRRFFGVVKRSSTLKNVLEMLQDNNIKFTIEGKKLIVKSS